MSFSYQGTTYRNFDEFERDFHPMRHETRVPTYSTPLVKHTVSKPKMNKTEAEYERMLVSRHGRENVWFNSIKFKVGEDTCWYCPDFAVRLLGDVIQLHEVKGGHVFDDARVKFKAAKLQYPMFRWVWAQKVKGQWKVQE